MDIMGCADDESKATVPQMSEVRAPPPFTTRWPTPSFVDTREQTDGAMGTVGSVGDQVVVAKREHHNVPGLELDQLAAIGEPRPWVPAYNRMKNSGWHHTGLDPKRSGQRGSGKHRAFHAY